MAADTPVGPFGATVAGVNALVPEATIRDAVPAGQRGVTTAQVTAWLDSLSARVARRLDGYETLPDELSDAEAAAGETTTDLEELITSARDLVHQGAASYLEAARHPEQAGKATTTYAAVLWDRFTTGLDELAGWLEVRLDRGDPADELAGGAAAPGLAYDFPPPSFTAGLAF